MPIKGRAKTDYMREYMRRRRAGQAKKPRAVAWDRLHHDRDSSQVKCDHCNQYIPFDEWGKGEHRPIVEPLVIEENQD